MLIAKERGGKVRTKQVPNTGVVLPIPYLTNDGSVGSIELSGVRFCFYSYKAAGLLKKMRNIFKIQYELATYLWRQ